MNVALILNYKAATETISCVESLLAHCPALNHVVVIDNDSQDGSVVAFNQWLEAQPRHNVTVLANPETNGYAGGNNYGLRWALDNLPVTNFWIVNNDTYVDSDALTPLLDALAQNDRQFVGSVILSADTGRLECYGGGKLYPLLGKAKLLGKDQTLEAMAQTSEQPDYLMGCSLAFSAKLIDRIGMMDEAYFMYSEEVDWQFQAQKKGVSIRVVPESRLFHYGGHPFQQALLRPGVCAGFGLFPVGDHRHQGVQPPQPCLVRHQGRLQGSNDECLTRLTTRSV